ncbi:carbonyl reductase [NADPH] 1-like [Pecten maximus]|uniref:carbonyl reductase [NADPH] 1-like n=1 Tax=Pecten maximus TaxID=6579 RepID=UPI00145830D3|nr:carbonyl reductase [NADPH] 1-like [Pecten maximus]XP_033752706.1 carbonyl reductase [NADPH] 1-like [Pecten maximus]
MGRRVAIVTGANRGIGLATVRNLCKTFSGDVILTSRMTPTGKEAVNSLKKEGLNAIFHELDISQPDSIRMLREYIEEHYGGIDVLINNAAMSFDKNEDIPIYRKAQLCFDVDFSGTLNVVKLFFTLLRPHARVVIMTNGYIGVESALTGVAKSKFSDSTLRLYDLELLANEYLKAVKFSNCQKFGWPDSPSQCAKIFLVKMANIVSKLMESDQRRNLLINACCPGWTRSGASREYTDKDGTVGGEVLQEPDTAAKDIVWLTAISSGTATPNGNLVRHKKVLNASTCT